MVKLDPDMMEVHIEDSDLYLHYQDMVDIFTRLMDEHGVGLIVHNQEYWSEDDNYHLVDLASQDDELRTHAVEIVKKTLEFAETVNATHVIIHPGGVTPEPIKKDEPLQRLKESLKEIGDKRVILENMPWFYIMRDRSVWTSNICVEADDFFQFTDLIGGVTLDICHAYLKTRKGGNEYILSMKNNLGNMIKHVHVSDAKPPHREGLQIGDGFIDFRLLRDINVGVVPEIISGHKNYGEGFRIAIERLRSLDREHNLL
jgi:N-acetylneuraminate synthase